MHDADPPPPDVREGLCDSLNRLRWAHRAGGLRRWRRREDMKRTALLFVGVLLTLGGVALAATPAVPIQSTGPSPTLATFTGHAAVAHRVVGVGVAWQDPFMAPNPNNSVHNDAWASDDYTSRSGPLGHRLRTFSTAIGRDCITLAFNHRGQIVGTCTDLGHGPGLYLLDPNTLATLAFLQLPFVP